MKGKNIMGVIVFSLILMLTIVGCSAPAKTTEKSKTKVETEATTATVQEEKEVSEPVSSGSFEEENHYSIVLPKAKWEKVGSIEEGNTTFSSNKGEIIKISYYQGKDSKAQRKEFPSSEKGAKKKVLSSKKDKLVDFDRMAVGEKSDAIIRMYYGVKLAEGDNKYLASYIISGEDATYIAEGTTASKKKESYERLKECVKSLDLFYSFD